MTELSITNTNIPSNNIEQSLNLVISAERGKEVKLSERSRVNENQLYVASLHQRLKQMSPSLAERLIDSLPEKIKEVKASAEKSTLFKAAGRIIRSMIRSGDLERGDYVKLRNFAFGKAQLDQDRSRLSSARISSSGDTSAVRSLTNAVATYETNQKASSSEIGAFKARVRASKFSVPQSTSQIPEGFLWKPESESDGNLVVLLPSEFTEGVNSVQILSPDGSRVLEEGRYSGIANGFRPHFRFSMPGKEFPDGAVVNINFADGRSVGYVVGETGSRIE